MLAPAISKKAERINLARTLLEYQRGPSRPATGPELLAISERQAYRYAAGHSDSSTHPGRDVKYLHRQAFAPSPTATPRPTAASTGLTLSEIASRAVLGVLAPRGRSWLTRRQSVTNRASGRRFDRLCRRSWFRPRPARVERRIAPRPAARECPEVVNEQTGRLYARVVLRSAKGEPHIASQVAALTQFAETTDTWSAEWQCQDDGYSGGTLIRPYLEALRILAAAGQIPAVLFYSP